MIRLSIIPSLAVLSCFLLAPLNAENQKPNIVLILSDDQAWTDYSFMGHPAIKTPHLDQLSQQSVTFRRGYVPTALCRPALASLATGLYSHQNRITGNDPGRTAKNKQHAEKTGKHPKELLIANIDQIPTLPRLLAPMGYLSFQCGKWWEGSYQRGGFSHGMTRGYPNSGGRHGDDGLTIGREGMKPVYDFIDTATAAQKPFFIWYAPFLPHTPHNPPERLLKKYTTADRPASIAKYYAMCEWFDETCGALLGRLDQKGLSENTLVIYVTDNGWIQDPQGAGFALRSKLTAYEGGTRTPIMFRWLGKIKPADRPELCSSLDIVPTILAAVGADIPKRLPGLNLLPKLQGGDPIQRNTLFGESFDHDIADVYDPEASLLNRWVIRGDYKLLLTYDGFSGSKYGRRTLPKDAQPQLFNLMTDPHEITNLATQKPELVKELGGLIHGWYPLNNRKVNTLPRRK
ncbi:MAG: sulfatase [Verrucomicrobiae bacterium]|nr:sulfatase [Verrucomicrobiae bacterium]NNJ42159.1 sulfatase [Akkermansiaceae bacterium]